MSRLYVLSLMILCLVVLDGAIARAERRSSTETGAADATDFDARDRLAYQEPRGRRPAGWIGPWPPRSAPAAPEMFPGGGDVASSPAGTAPEPAPTASGVTMTAEEPPVFRDVAVPPAELRAGLSIPSPPTEGAEHALSGSSPRRGGKGKAAPLKLSSRSGDLERASYGTFKPGLPEGSGELHGRFTWSSITEKEPVPLYTRVGFVTLVELKSGERPAGGAFCGSCARVTADGQVSAEGDFIVEAMADKVSIRPRHASSIEEGLLATNLHIVTDAGRTLTFDVIEVSGTDLAPTARHEVRGTRDEGSAILDYSFPARVEEASRVIEERLREGLASQERDLVAVKASNRMDTYSDAKVHRKVAGRKLLIEAATTVGDETVIRMRVEGASPGQMGDPVALLEGSGRSRILRTRSVFSQPEGSTLVITLSIEGILLGKDQRIAVSMLDKLAGEELRSSVGRG